ncbi:hypothetical protein [Actinoallomurus sp. CA-150999]|uniref:hypothetical protein n=1 Tax=Actinoallomurus sp. CA-150999 TaxID=3239887 RepID=UPI003D93772D
MTSDDTSSRKPGFEPPQEEEQAPRHSGSGASRNRVPGAAARRPPKGRRAWALTGAAVILAGGGLLWALWPDVSSRPSSDASPRATSTALAVPPGPGTVSLAQSGQILGLPVLYSTIKAAVPPGVRWEGPGANTPPGFNIDDQLYIWGTFSESSARALRMEIIRYSSNNKASAALRSDQAGCTGQNKERCAGYSPPEAEGSVQIFAGKTGRFETLGNLGDDAFSVPVIQQRFKSPSAMEQNETTYDVGGSVVECRFRNVRIIINWRGADYPVSAAGHSPLQGTRLPYGQSRDQAISMVRAIISKLAR